MAKYIVFVSLYVAVCFWGCNPNGDYPWDNPLDIHDTTDTGQDTADVHHFSLCPSASVIFTGEISGSMIKIPAYDSFYVDTADDTFHVASGFVDNEGDTAFVTRAFLMDTVEVTKAEWCRVMGDVSDTLPKLHPKTGISWFDAIRYCMKRTDLEGLGPCYDTTGWQPAQYPYTGPAVNWDATGYRLPTEDEWEYAARANADLLYPTVDGTLDSTKANTQGRVDTALADFNVLRTYDSVWLRLTPGAVYFDHITRSGVTVSDTEAYAAKTLESGACVYSFSLIKYLDTNVLLDTHYIDGFTTHESSYSVPDPIFPEDPDQAVIHYVYDTMLISYRLADTVKAYDTLTNKTERFTPLGGSLTTKVISSEINLIDSISLNKIYDTDSIFVFVDTTQDTTLLTGSYQWFGFKSAASYPPSPYRLYDMAGNASEWCWEADNPSRPVFRINEHGPDQGTARMRRGGDYTSADYYLQSGGRNLSINPAVITGKIGFRTVRRAP